MRRAIRPAQNWQEANMIITKQTAQRLIRNGKASGSGLVYDDGKTYMALIRHDQQRVDHYFIGHGDLR